MAVFTAVGSKGHHEYVLTVIDNTPSGTFIEGITHNVSYTLELRPIKEGYSWKNFTGPNYLVTYEINFGYATATDKIVEYDGESTVLIKQGEFVVGQTENGTFTIPVKLTITDTVSDTSLGSGNASIDTTMALNPQTKLGMLHIKNSGAWIKGRVWIKDSGAWKTGIPWIKVNGVWQKGGA